MPFNDWSDHARPTPLPLPSILDLGRHASAACLSADPSPQPGHERPDEDQRQAVFWDREKALRDLLLTFRATTLSEAATQLYVGFLVSEDLTNFEMPSEERSRCQVALRRVFLSAIPVVADAAALDLAEIGGEYIADYAAREFPVRVGCHRRVPGGGLSACRLDRPACVTEPPPLMRLMFLRCRGFRGG